ncbi:DUF1542 domain-containing protein, partial [Streptococcus pneumoniae]|nr:DUF1542 domain-containing protein [Streptococcus pneumoniae]
MKELHARVEESLARAKAVLENPNSSQEEVNTQVQAMKALTEEVNKALAGGLTSPAQLGEGRSATQSEPSPTPRQGRRGRKPQTPPAAPVSTENQETKETAEEATDYTNGPGSYPLSENIHNLLQELKTSTENPKQVQKLKEAYDKLNEALGQSDNGLVDQEVFNVALEEYKKAAQLKNGAEGAAKTRSRKSVSGLATGRPGRERRLTNSDGSGSERSAEETSNSDQRTPARRARSVEGNRASALNGQYVYGINQKPVPDDKYDDYNYLLGHWAEGMFNWLTANAKPGIFELYDDSVDGLKIRRKIRRPRARRDQLYKDEATTDRLVLDVFVHHPSATHVALNIVPGGDGRAKLKVIGPNDRILDEINIPKNHLWIKQSEWNEREKERKKVEDALRRRNAVRAGLGRRAAGAGGVYEDQINTESRGNIPNGASLSNRNLFFVGHSTEENIADITVSNLEGLGLSTKKEGLYTPKAILKAEGTIPTNVYGQRTVTVRTRTEGGYEASQNVTLTFGLPKPRITTSNRDLLEKANTRPTVRAELPGPVDTKNIPSGTKLRMYLVKGGYDNSSDPNHIFADGYTIVAETDVGNDGRAVFNDSKYVLGQIDTENLKVVAALVSSTSGTPLEGLKSALSSDSVRATEPLGREAAKEALEQAAEDKKRQIDQNPDLIETEKQAAKQKVQEALDAAKETLKQATDANGVDGARDGGTTAINKVPQEGPTKQAAKEALE